MATLYVTENGVQVHKQGQRLLVKKGPDIIQDIPMIKVDRVVLMGKGASITTPTLFALSSKKIGVFFLNSRGRYMLRTVGEEHNNSLLRMAQARISDDGDYTLRIARAIVNGKVNNQRVLVQRHAEGADWARNALVQMDTMRKQVENAQTLDEVRGCEGLAAKNYFSLLRQILQPPRDGNTWGFDRRAYYPPSDPINAMLSFGYTLLLNDMIAACQISGLDPHLGFFHANNYNKPSLALDLAEEFRPVIVDSIVLTAVNRRLFCLNDFEAGRKNQSDDDDEEEETRNIGKNAVRGAVSGFSLTITSQKPTVETPYPVYMKMEARRRFIQLYEMRVNEKVLHPSSGEQTAYRRVFELQAYAFSKMLLKETDRYTPFMIR